MYEYRVIDVLRVVDGDTVDVRISLGFGMTAAIRVRVAGVDAPEVYGTNASPEGVAARDFVAEWLDRPGLVLRTFKGSDATVGIGDGAFGRWLGAFHDSQGGSLADAMIAAGHVKAA